MLAATLPAPCPPDADDGSAASAATDPTNGALHMTRRTIAVLAAFMVALVSSACGGSDSPDAAPAPALNGAWNIYLTTSTGQCNGTMTIDGATGSGTFLTCVATPGTVTGSVAANNGVTLNFSPTGYGAFSVTGLLTSPTQIDGNIRGSGWNGERFRAIHQ